MIGKVSEEKKADALDPKASAVRRRRQLWLMFLSGMITFLGEAGGGMYWLITKGAWDPNIFMAMLVSGSVMAAAAGIYQWSGKNRDKGGLYGQ